MYAVWMRHILCMSHVWRHRHIICMLHVCHMYMSYLCHSISYVCHIYTSNDVHNIHTRCYGVHMYASRILYVWHMHVIQCMYVICMSYVRHTYAIIIMYVVCMSYVGLTEYVMHLSFSLQILLLRYRQLSRPMIAPRGLRCIGVTVTRRIPPQGVGRLRSISAKLKEGTWRALPMDTRWVSSSLSSRALPTSSGLALRIYRSVMKRYINDHI